MVNDLESWRKAFQDQPLKFSVNGCQGHWRGYSRWNTPPVRTHTRVWAHHTPGGWAALKKDVPLRVQGGRPHVHSWLTVIISLGWFQMSLRGGGKCTFHLRCSWELPPTASGRSKRSAQHDRSQTAKTKRRACSKGPAVSWPTARTHVGSAPCWGSSNRPLELHRAVVCIYMTR